MPENIENNPGLNPHAALQITADNVIRLANEIVQYAGKEKRKEPNRITWANVKIMQFIEMRLKQTHMDEFEGVKQDA